MVTQAGRKKNKTMETFTHLGNRRGKSQHRMKSVLCWTLDLQVTEVRWERCLKYSVVVMLRAGTLGAASRGREKGRPLFSGEVHLLLPLDSIVPLCKAFTLMESTQEEHSSTVPGGFAPSQAPTFPFPPSPSQG